MVIRICYTNFVNDHIMKSSKIKRIELTLKEITNYLVFLAEELPSFLTIMSIPVILGILVMIPYVGAFISIIICLLLVIYLYIRSLKHLKVKKLNKTWIVCLGITFVISMLLEGFVVAIAMTNIKLSLK
jgi:hypothetical protein